MEIGSFLIKRDIHNQIKQLDDPQYQIQEDEYISI
jgi:hypothetical protein